MAILRKSARLFGPNQRERYARTIAAAAELAATEPFRPGSRARDELGKKESTLLDSANLETNPPLHCLQISIEDGW